MPTNSILLVDDEKILLDLFMVGLRSLPFAIHKASGGREALQILEREKPALVVLDLAMPDISGLELLARIRADVTLAGTKVLILTAVPVLLDDRSANMADEVLYKPVNMRDLQYRIQNMLEAH
jgi:DNA-binding response OmpR family regulator